MTENRNAALYFVDRHVTEGRAEKIAFREAADDRRQITYGELATQSGRVAGALTRAEIQREERAIVLVLDQIEYPQIFWGCLKDGVIPVPLNTLLSTSLYDTVLRDSRAACLFVSQELLPVVGPALKDNPYLRKVVVIGGDAPDKMVSYSDFLDGCAPSDPIEVSGDEVAFWLYSSGSTGQPKGVRHIHDSLKSTADTYGDQVLGIREDDVVYSVAKIFFAYGLGNAMTFPMSVGATTVLLAGRPTPDVVVDILEKERATVFCGVPTLYAATVAYLEQASGKRDLALRTC
ncbi:MAG: AMP-binding protein, partial [Marinosulfonomonas sp.]|nr:AMP-binding protein [Marinosulfonomonas sp.]